MIQGKTDEEPLPVQEIGDRVGGEDWGHDDLEYEQQDDGHGALADERARPSPTMNPTPTSSSSHEVELERRAAGNHQVADAPVGEVRGSRRGSEGRRDDEPELCHRLQLAAAVIPAPTSPPPRASVSLVISAPLGVGLAEDQASIAAELGFQLGEITEAAVGRHRAAVHNERVGVTHRPPAGRRPADVRHEGRGFGLPGFADELGVAERRFGLLVEHGFARGAEAAEPGAVGVAVSAPAANRGRPAARMSP